ncbi:MAG: hypothetical protein AAF809_07120 [Bacteroidota bacterium]
MTGLPLRTCTLGVLALLFSACASTTPPEVATSEPTASGPISTCDAFPAETVERDGLAITVVRHHCIEASAPDADGLYAYYYDYDRYELSAGAVVLTARTYRDSDSGHLLSLVQQGTRRSLESADLDTPLAAEALARLRAQGKVNLQWFNGRAYVPIESKP